MPTNKNAVVRYKILDVLLSDRVNQYSMEEITDKMNERLKDLGYAPVVKRTIEKDIVFLQERPFCAPIKRYKYEGKTCIKYSISTFSIFHYDLSKEEMSLLHELINALGRFNDIPNFKWLEGLRIRLGLEKHKQVLSFSQLSNVKNNNVLAGLYESILNQKVIDIQFKNSQEKSPYLLTMHPYIMKEYNNRWFLLGLYAENNQVATIPIDSIESFTNNENIEYIEYKGNIEDFFVHKTNQEDYEHKLPEKIVFWADDGISMHINMQPLSECLAVSEVENKMLRSEFNLPEGGHIFTLHSLLNNELQQEFVRYFSRLLVIKPEALRKEMEQKTTTMSEFYKNIKK